MALWHPSTPLRQGECLEVFCENGQVAEVVKDFIPAGQRITLGISLHPDRMKDSDWQALPGIGPRLADRIIKDRQKNGDFGGLQALQRVPGIGPGTVKRLEKFF
jgi:competence protein ComEA